MTSILRHIITSTLERHPFLGYISAGFSTGAGVISWIEPATKIVGFVAACVGLAVGVITYRVQAATLRKVRASESEGRRE